jgi:DNA-binding response OmpR family regulator
MNTCPLCHGRPIKPTTLLVDRDGQRASRFGLVVHLTRYDAKVLDILNRSRPRDVSFDAIIMDVYGEKDEPGNAGNVLKVRISYLRKAIKALGVSVVNVARFGYRLEFHNEGIAYDEQHQSMAA